MSVCLFVSFPRAAVASEELGQARIGERCLVHTPAEARDPFLDDGAPPALVVQAYFAHRLALEAALAELARTLGPGASCEAMTVRRFPVPRPGRGGCSYLVAYSGTADDPHAWREHYNAHHAPLMAELPGIRELEVYSPVPLGFVPAGWEPVRSLQRNKVAFDTPQAMQAALASPVRAKMRADFASFPPWRGQVTHYPMLSFEPWQKT